MFNENLELHNKKVERINQELDKVADERERFLLNRQKGLGGSDMGKIMGLSKWGSPYSVWLSKTGRDIVDHSSLATELGTFCEEFVAQKYSQITGYQVKKVKSIASKKYPFLLANFDRLAFKDGQIVGGLECKTCGQNVQVLDLQGNYRNKWGDGNVYENGVLVAENDEIDPEYYAQVQHYLAVSQLQWWDVAVLISNQSFRIYRVYPNLPFIQDMIEQGEQFWCVNVLNDVAPAKDMSTLKDERGTGETIQADVELLKLLTEYNKINTEMEKLKKDLNAQKELIAQHLGDNNKATYIDATGKEKTAVTFKGTSRTMLDSARLEKELPDIYKSYSKTVETARSLRVFYK